MDVTAQTLRDAEFRMAFRGYDTAEVDDFLERVAAGIEALQARVRAESDRAAQADARAAQAEARAVQAEGRGRAEGDGEDSVMRTLVLAQRAADLVVKEAKAAADEIVAEAHAQAAEIVAQAERSATRLEQEAETQRLAREAEEQAQAGSIVERARADADAVRADAQADAARLVAEAEQQAAAITTGAEERAASVVALAEARRHEVSGAVEQLESRRAALAAELANEEQAVVATRRLATGARDELRAFAADLLQRVDVLAQTDGRLDVRPPLDAAAQHPALEDPALEDPALEDPALDDPVDDPAAPAGDGHSAEQTLGEQVAAVLAVPQTVVWADDVTASAPGIDADDATAVDTNALDATADDTNAGDTTTTVGEVVPWSAAGIDLGAWAPRQDDAPADGVEATADPVAEEAGDLQADDLQANGSPRRGPTAFAVFPLDELVPVDGDEQPVASGVDVPDSATAPSADEADEADEAADAATEAGSDESLDFHVVLRPPEPRPAPLPRFDEPVEAGPRRPEGTLAARLRRALDDD